MGKQNECKNYQRLVILSLLLYHNSVQEREKPKMTPLEWKWLGFNFFAVIINWVRLFYLANFYQFLSNKIGHELCFVASYRWSLRTAGSKLAM